MGAGMEGVVDLRRLVSRREPDDVELNEKLAVWERSTTWTDLTVRTAAKRSAGPWCRGPRGISRALRRRADTPRRCNVSSCMRFSLKPGPSRFRRWCADVNFPRSTAGLKAGSGKPPLLSAGRRRICASALGDRAVCWEVLTSRLAIFDCFLHGCARADRHVLIVARLLLSVFLLRECRSSTDRHGYKSRASSYGGTSRGGARRS